MKLLLEIPFRASRFSFCLHTVFLLLSVLAIFLCDLSLRLQLLLVLSTTAVVAYSWQQQLKNLPGKIHFNTKGWFLEYNDKRIKVEPTGEWVVLPWLVVMVFKQNKKKPQRVCIALWWDAVEEGDFRSLRALIRHFPSDSP